MRAIELIGVPGAGKSTVSRVAINAYPDALCAPEDGERITRLPSCLGEIAGEIGHTESGSRRVRRAAIQINRAIALGSRPGNATAVVDAGPAQQGLSLALERPSAASLDRYFETMPAPDGVVLVTADREAVIHRNRDRAQRGGRDLSDMHDALAPLAVRAMEIFAARGIPTETIDTMNSVTASAQQLRDFAIPAAALKTLGGYREDNGLLWPAADPKAPRISRESVNDIAIAVRYCRDRRVAVQAGGNCGVWPRRMAETFGTVYTFEPDAQNFTALAVNTADLQNVIRFQAALGDEHGFVDLERRTVNCGAHYIDGPGPIPIMRIDELGLPACDLIYLDIEGYELKALRGAVQTIAEHRPVIAFEDKGLSDKFGSAQGDIEKWLATDFDYRLAERVRRDVLMVPA